MRDVQEMLVRLVPAVVRPIIGFLLGWALVSVWMGTISLMVIRSCVLIVTIRAGLVPMGFNVPAVII